MICPLCHSWWRVPEGDEYTLENVQETVKCQDLVNHIPEWVNWSLIENGPDETKKKKWHKVN